MARFLAIISIRNFFLAADTSDDGGGGVDGVVIDFRFISIILWNIAFLSSGLAVSDSIGSGSAFVCVARFFASICMMKAFLLGDRVLVSVALVTGWSTGSGSLCLLAIMRFKNASLLADGVVLDVIDGGGGAVGFCFIKFNKNDFLSLIGAFGELLFAIKSDFTNTLFSSTGSAKVVVVATVDFVTRAVLGFRRFKNAILAAFTVLDVVTVVDVVGVAIFRIRCRNAILAGFKVVVVVEVVVVIALLLEVIRFKNASLAGFIVVVVAIVVDVFLFILLRNAIRA